MSKHPRTIELNLLLALCAMSVTGVAHAGNGVRHDGAEKLRAKFSAADTNHDGLLDRSEAAAGMPRIGKHFDEADANHDGKLSQAEVAEYVMNIRAARR